MKKQTDVISCDRCKIETNTFSVSYFNTDSICTECEKIESVHPLFQPAKRANDDAICRGEFDFEGVGLPDDFFTWAKFK